MISTSIEFQNEVTTQTKARDMHAKAVFRLVDVDAKDDCTASSTSTSSISDPSLMIDDVEGITINYATCEPNRWLADGSFALLPDEPPYENMGWWSDLEGDLSDATSREFATEITNTFQCTVDQSTSGFTVLWDVTNGEFAEDFTIKYYDGTNTLIQTVNIVGNTDADFVDDTAVANWRKIELIIEKWSVGERIARIEEVIFGIVKTYSKELENLIGLKVDRQLDVIAEDIVEGKLNFTIDNQDQAFNILNPTGIFQFLQKNQRIDAFLGVNTGAIIEYVPMGKYYLDDWSTNENTLEASFDAVDWLERMRKQTYYKGLNQTRSLYDLAIDVCTDFGLDATEYSIDTALQSITPTAFLPICNYKQALQYIAIAGQAVLYCDREGIVTIEQMGNTNTGVTIDIQNAFEPSPKINLTDVLKRVDTKVYTITTSASTTQVAKATVDISGTQTIIIEYDFPASSVNAGISAGTLDSATYYTNACFLTITHTGSTTITLTGNQIALTTSINETTTTSDEGEVRVIENQLITTTALAINVGAYIKQELEKRNIFFVNWRMNPSLEITDIVDVENQFETSEDVRIIKQNFVFTGALDGTTEVRG